MRISKLRALDALRRVRLELPIYNGGDRIIEWLLAEGLATALPVPGGRRIGVSDSGVVAILEMADAESHGALRGCWGEAVSFPSFRSAPVRRSERRAPRG